MEPRPSVFDTVLLRIGLLSTGGLLIHLTMALTNQASGAYLPLDTMIMIVLGGLGLYVLVRAGLRSVPDYLRWLILAAYVTDVIVQALLWIQTSNLADLVLVDPGLYTDLAGELLRHGQNPYTWDYASTFDLYRTGQFASTPRLNGAPESNYPYPALAFLLVIPFQSLGLPGVFSLSILAHIATLVLVFNAAPRRWQPVVLLPMLVGIGNAELDFIRLTLIGAMDIVWVLAVIGMLVAWRHKKWRAILFGVAVSLKQSPALLAPFLVVKLWKDAPDQRPRHLAEFILLAAGTFFMINGPFVLVNPGAWFRGYTEPLRDSLVILSQGGFSTLAQFGIAYLPKSYFLFATVSVLCLLLFVYSRHYNWMRGTLWTLPGILMWFSYRSLAQYWLFWVIPLIFVAANFRRPALSRLSQQVAWKPTLSVIACTITALLIGGAVFALPEAPLQLNLKLPMHSTFGLIDELTLDVTNNSNGEFEPRFGVQSINNGLNPLPWTIVNGPKTLRPGETATYGLTSSRANHNFFAHQAVQLVVTDAGGDYSLRGVLTIEADRSYLWPDAIFNPDYRIWDSPTGTPLFWTILGNGTVQPTRLEGLHAIRLVSSATPENLARVALANTFLFPRAPLGIWLRPPADDSTIAYGLEIRDGNHRLWILFGPRAYSGPVDEGTYVIHRPAPARKWTYQEVDLAAAFAQAGWLIPPLRQTFIRGLSMEARKIDLHLLFISRTPAIEAATFGPITQVAYRLPPETLMAEVFGDPAGYYVRLAETYLSQQNMQRALDAYQLALRFAPGDQNILARIEWLNKQPMESQQ